MKVMFILERERLRRRAWTQRKRHSSSEVISVMGGDKRIKVIYLPWSGNKGLLFSLLFPARPAAGACLFLGVVEPRDHLRRMVVRARKTDD